MILRSVPLIASALLHTTAVVAFYGGGQPVATRSEVVIPLELMVEAPVSAPHEPAVEPEGAAADVSVRHPHVHPYPVTADHDARPHPAHQTHVTAAAGPFRAELDAPAPLVEATATAPELPHFVIASGSRGRPASPRTDGAGDAAPADLPVAEALVSLPAKLLASGPATYPADARIADEEADVPLEIVVDASGRVIDARVSKVIGSGFDESALRAIRAYRFQPAVRDGRPVAVRMKWVVQFEDPPLSWTPRMARRCARSV